MGNVRNLFFGLLLGAVAVSAYDTTLAYSGGRQSGTFKMDGRANLSYVARMDAPDTVYLGSGLRITRVVNNGGGCITGCSYPIPTWLAFHVDGGDAGFRTGPDSAVAWESALSFPPQLRPLDSIPGYLSPCGAATGLYGFGFAVSSDDATSNGPGCADLSTFRTFPGHDRILYHRKDGISLKLQVTGFEFNTMQCESTAMPINCTYANNVVFRYVVTDDSTGYFGSDPMSLRSPRKARVSVPSSSEPWKSRLYRMILGRRLSSESRP